MTNDYVISKAVEVLLGGGIIIYPTDTAFGIGCLLDKPDAVDRLFTIRRRPLSQAAPVLVSSKEMALEYLSDTPDIVRLLMDKYWPGALTIVSQCQQEKACSPVRGGGTTIGVRMPNHSTALLVIERCGVPILGPSANFHGNPTPFIKKDLDPELIKLVDLVLPGECLNHNVSTVVDCTGQNLSIIRQGAVIIDFQHLGHE